jgi:hypothetical protein
MVGNGGAHVHLKDYMILPLDLHEDAVIYWPASSTLSVGMKHSIQISGGTLMPRLDQQAVYIVKINGHIDASLVDWFGPVKVTNSVEDGGQFVSTLSGIIADQAGLMGLIRHLHGLGVVLLSIERAAEHTTNAQGDKK